MCKGVKSSQNVLVQVRLVNDRQDWVATNGAGLAAYATRMTRIEVTTRVENCLLCGIVANETLLLLRILIDLDLRWGLLGEIDWLDDFNVFGVLDTVVILVSSGHEFDDGRFDTEMSTLHTKVTWKLAVRGGEVA